jgi:hypothetical protein
MELEYLNLQSIVVAYERKEEHSIPEKQLKLLQSALLKTKNVKKKGKHPSSSSLGINNSSIKKQ